MNIDTRLYLYTMVVCSLTYGQNIISADPFNLFIYEQEKFFVENIQQSLILRPLLHESHDSKCQTCKGAGRFKSNKNLFVTIPQGIDDNMQIRLQGEGEPGIGRGENGDLYVLVKVEEHDIFERSGNNIQMTIELNIPTLVLGGTIIIPTIQGEENLTIAPGTQSGQVFRIRGKGIVDVREKNKRGDQLVTVNVKIPKKLNKEQTELYKKIQQITEDDTKKNVSDWLKNKIKDTFS